MSRIIKKKTTVESRTKALMGNYKRCTFKDVHFHIKFIMTDDVHIWYFMMGAMIDADDKGEFSGDNDEFLKGQFFGIITATAVYPYGPPDVKMLTPTGVFPLNNSDFCIDMGKYHKENYPAALGMDGYTKMIWSGLVGWKELGVGINMLSGRTSKKEQLQEIKKASLKSQEYNRKYNAELVELFRCNDLDEKKTVEIPNKKSEPLNALLGNLQL
jgi:ubiquitin-protein ligase